VPAELVADKGYHSRATLKALDDGPWKTRIAELKRDGFLRWHGDDGTLAAGGAVHAIHQLIITREKTDLLQRALDDWVQHDRDEPVSSRAGIIIEPHDRRHPVLGGQGLQLLAGAVAAKAADMQPVAEAILERISRLRPAVVCRHPAVIPGMRMTRAPWGR
jgi:hypothetical protein